MATFSATAGVTLATTLAVTIAAFTALWALSLRLRDAGIVDIYWGPGFVVIAGLAFWLEGRSGAASLVFLACLSVWGLRLGWHIAARHNGVEDARYRAMRDRHGPTFGRRSLWAVFWLQAAVQWLASSPALVIAVAPATAIHWALWVGLAAFLAGFLVEVTADSEVRRFRADPVNQGRLLTTGLHAHVRHPNYLGEITLQWGLGLMALAITGNPVALAGPALMHILIVRVSGVPLLEAQLAARDGFAEWKARTNALWPRIRR